MQIREPAHSPAFGNRTLALSIGAGSIGLLILGIMPVLLASLVGDGRIGEALVGNLVSVEYLAIAFGSVLGLSLLRRLDARIGGGGAALGLAAANASMLFHAGQPIVFAARAVAETCGGILVSLALVTISQSRSPERGSAYFFAAQTVMQLSLAIILPWLAFNGSLGDGGYLALAVAGCLAVAISAFMPRHLPPPRAAEKGAALPPVAIAGLIVTALYQGAAAAGWSYVVIWLKENGHSETLATRAIAISLAFQVLGAMIATRLSERISSRKVIVASSVMQCLLFLALFHFAANLFLVYLICAAFGFLWLFSLPSFTGWLIELDPSRRAVLALAAAQLLGSAALPSLASFATNETTVGGAFLFSVYVLALVAALAGAVNFWQGRTAISASD